MLIFCVTLLGVAAAGFFRWSHSKSRSPRWYQAATSNLTGQGLPQGQPDPERAGKVRHLAAYWNEHKARLRQLLTVDYAAALAKRNSAASDLAAVVKFGEAYANNFERQNRGIFPRAEEQDKRCRAKVQEIESQGRGIPADLLLYERWLADTQPIPGNLTISALARQHGPDDPNGLIFLRRVVAGMERRAFQDEAAAQRAETLQTSQEMVDYILAARPRWEAEQTGVYKEAGYDAQVSEYLLGSRCAAMVNVLTENYQRQSNKALDDIGREIDAIFQAMDESFLAASSRDDEESRRLLTELRSLVLLRQQEKAGP